MAVRQVKQYLEVLRASLPAAGESALSCIANAREAAFGVLTKDEQGVYLLCHSD